MSNYCRMSHLPVFFPTFIFFYLFNNLFQFSSSQIFYPNHATSQVTIFPSLRSWSLEKGAVVSCVKRSSITLATRSFCKRLNNTPSLICRSFHSRFSLLIIIFFSIFDKTQQMKSIIEIKWNWKISTIKFAGRKL